MRIALSILSLIFLLLSCGPQPPEELPVLGQARIENGDTIPHTIPDFRFRDQDSTIITNSTFADRMYVADFFFISCPTICPKVKQQMLRIYQAYEGTGELAFLSHTIDVKHDTIPRLKKYADNLGVSADRWHFVTGEQKAIYDIADDYFSIAIEDPSIPGGFDHSGRLILVDKDRQVRSFCNGTDPVEVDRFMKDIDLLLQEYRSTEASAD